ncbi:hypothetical protein F2P56_001302 [Juglans regia]|uniref:GATA-type domain-containing protein n=1 Tax=Juglans regia TaxID=51240 RepID=A0A833Y6U5_JUGRE|nr:hypothetical protein F2P56_001302 [Juglans regia]
MSLVGFSSSLSDFVEVCLCLFLFSVVDLRGKRDDRLEDLSPDSLDDLNAGSNPFSDFYYKQYYSSAGANFLPIYSDFESQLCVPQDSLDDIDMFPSFTNDSISSQDLCSVLESREVLSFDDINIAVTPEQESEEIKRMPFQTCDRFSNENHGSNEQTDFIDFSGAGKKPRTKQRCGRSYASLDMKRKYCSHCQAEKTPQWREGPSGPKTLCNACGVRYKSGRLVPEYRPSASPTFDVGKHSNFHRQILKWRRPSTTYMLNS